MSEGTRQVFNLGQVYAQIGDHYREIGAALRLPLLDPSASLDEETVFRLALITTFQYAEGLADLAIAQAIGSRKDWRYALHLPEKHPEFSAPLLCRFRASLYFSTQAAHEFEQLLDILRKEGLLSIHSDALVSEKVLSRVCSVTHFFQLMRSIKTAISSLAVDDSEWLRANAQPYWYERYKTGRLDQPVELSEIEIQKEVIRMGRDIQYLLRMFNTQGMSRLADQAEILILEQILEREFLVTSDQMSWRAPMRATCKCIGLELSRSSSLS